MVSQVSPCSTDNTMSSSNDATVVDRPAVFCELCAGSAGLSAQLQRKSFHVVAIDYAGNQHEPKAHIFELDLAQQNSRDLLHDMLNNMRPQGLHMGLPCGTCSRARDTPIDAKLKKLEPQSHRH